MIDAMALAAIRAHQRWLSPWKGYACAYRVAHGGTGCSGHARDAIAGNGLRAAWPLIRARLRACQAAALMLRDGGNAAPAKERNQRRSERGWWYCCDPGGCADLRCASSKASAADGCDLPCGCDF